MANGVAMNPQAPSPGDASSLVLDINQKLSQLMELMDKSQVVDDGDKQALAQIQQAYQGFVQNNLGSQPGQKPTPPSPQIIAGSVPQESGAANAQPMGPQGYRG